MQQAAAGPNHLKYHSGLHGLSARLMMHRPLSLQMLLLGAAKGKVFTDL